MREYQHEEQLPATTDSALAVLRRPLILPRVVVVECETIVSMISLLSRFPDLRSVLS